MNYFKLQITLITISLFSVLNVNAQINSSAQESNFWEHVRFGGSLGLSTSNDFFTLGVAPSAIYEFNQQFALGVSLNYTYNQYLRRKYFRSISSYSRNSAFCRIRTIKS